MVMNHELMSYLSMIIQCSPPWDLSLSAHCLLTTLSPPIYPLALCPLQEFCPGWYRLCATLSHAQQRVHPKLVATVTYLSRSYQGRCSCTCQQNSSSVGTRCPSVVTIRPCTYSSHTVSQSKTTASIDVYLTSNILGSAKFAVLST